MASLAFPSLAKKATLSDGTTYGYVYIPAQPSKPTLLLLHGAPSSCYDWRHQIEHLPKAGYGVLAPDLLGYGDSDKPAAIEAYRLQYICKQVDDLIQLQGLDKVVGVGHDWGSGVLSYLAVFYRHRFSALAFVAVGYLDLSLSFDIDAVNAATKEAIGFSTSGYVALFNSDHGAALIEEKSESFDSLMYAADPMAWRQYLGAEGACEAFLKEGKILPMGNYISAEEVEMHSNIMKGCYTYMLNWYKSLCRLGPTEAEKALTAEDKTLHVPVLMVVTEKDYVIVPEGQLQSTQAYSDNVTVARRDTAHWTMLEDRDGFENVLEEWVASL